MPKIDDYYARYRELSKAASDGARQLNFAAIAIVWIFKLQSPAGVRLPRELLLPTLCIVVSLALDLLHYFGGALVWRFWARHLEHLERKAKKAKKPVDENLDYRHPKSLPLIQEIFFYSKIVAMAIAYVLIAKYLWANLTLS